MSTVVTYIDHSGSEVESYAPGMEYRAVAKKIEGQLVRHYIYRANGHFIDTRQVTLRDLKKARKHLTPVSEQVYELYVKYINGQTKSSLNSIERLL